MATSDRDARIVIVGAGCFGLSTAYHLQQRGYTNITLLERASTHPAPDAASTDINKIVRSAYTDAFYCAFAREAIELWKDTEVWGDCYNECVPGPRCHWSPRQRLRRSGVLVLADDVNFLGTTNVPLANDRAAGAAIRELRSGAEVAAAFPPSAHPGIPTGRSGYLNPEGGWADAQGAIRRLARIVVEAGASLRTGHEVIGLAHDAFGGVSGVRVKGKAEPVEADLVVVASGAWTVSSFADPELRLNGRIVATGCVFLHCVETSLTCFR